MKSLVLAISMIIIPFAILAQGVIRPVLDSTVTCSYYKGLYEYSENAATAKQTLELFYIVEGMPVPILPKSDIEDILNDVILMDAQEMSLSGDIYIQCVVNCKGRAGDFQIIDCPAKILNIGYQVLNSFRTKIYEWEPGEQRGYNVDVIINIRVSVNEGKFSVVAPVE